MYQAKKNEDGKIELFKIVEMTNTDGEQVEISQSLGFVSLDILNMQKTNETKLLTQIQNKLEDVNAKILAVNNVDN